MNTQKLINFFKEDLFMPKLKSHSKDAVLAELIEPLVENGYVKNRDILLETLKKRETLGSTGIGKGVAIPHCRTLAVSSIFIVIGLSREGIEYQAMDKKKVHLFFMIVAPPQEETNLYLPVLGKIVEVVRDSKFRRKLLKIKDYASLIEIFT
jgi:PTS system nitrogen regulatory IIA component